MSYNATTVYPKYQDVIDSQKHMNSMYDLLNNGNYVITGFDMSMSGLTINITAGRCFVSGVHLTFPAGSLTLPANSTVYVKVVLQVNASNKPTGAIITYESTSGGTNKMNLAQVVTTSSAGTITDMRVFISPTLSKQTLTSSGSMYTKAFWSFVILLGGGGGGLNSTNSNAHGGIGGAVNIDHCLHNGSGAVSWTIGAGGIGGNTPTSGGTTSITTSLQTINAAGGGPGGGLTTSQRTTGNSLTLFGILLGGSLQFAHISASQGSDYLYALSPFMSPAAFYFSGYSGSFVMSTEGLGTKMGFGGSMVAINQGQFTYGAGGHTSSSPTNGTAGAIIWYRLELIS